MQLYFSIFSNANWPHESTLVLQDVILSTLRNHVECSALNHTLHWPNDVDFITFLLAPRSGCGK